MIAFNTVFEASQFGLMLHCLGRIDAMDQRPNVDYAKRYVLLITAHMCALRCGIPSGFRIDPADPDWPVLFFELPTGQVSWHVEPHASVWDGHTNAEKHQRIQACIQAQDADHGD